LLKTEFLSQIESLHQSIFTLEKIPHSSFVWPFTKALIRIFGAVYLRAPNEEDTKRLIAHVEARGRPDKLWSVYCMHWRWKKCSTSWHEQYISLHRDPTIVLEVVASEDLSIWHCFFGLPGPVNDIKNLLRSPIFASLASGDAPTHNYTFNCHRYTLGYYLADAIYPSWLTFVKTI
jgi:hypothetical protein